MTRLLPHALPFLALLVLAPLLRQDAHAEGLDETVYREASRYGLGDAEVHSAAGLGMGATFWLSAAIAHPEREPSRTRLAGTMAACFAVAAAKETHDHYRKGGWSAADMWNSAGPSCVVGALFIGDTLAQAFVYVEPPAVDDDGNVDPERVAKLTIGWRF